MKKQEIHDIYLGDFYIIQKN